jgi:hypothetical protein
MHDWICVWPCLLLLSVLCNLVGHSYHCITSVSFLCIGHTKLLWHLQMSSGTPLYSPSHCHNNTYITLTIMKWPCVAVCYGTCSYIPPTYIAPTYFSLTYVFILIYFCIFMSTYCSMIYMSTFWGDMALNKDAFLDYSATKSESQIKCLAFKYSLHAPMFHNDNMLMLFCHWFYTCIDFPFICVHIISLQ